MKRVICIDGVKVGDAGNTYSGQRVALPKEVIFEGEQYTVVEEIEHLGEMCYMLFERPVFSLYKKRRFIPLSDIDETEFVRETKKELV